MKYRYLGNLSGLTQSAQVTNFWLSLSVWRGRIAHPTPSALREESMKYILFVIMVFLLLQVFAFIVASFDKGVYDPTIFWPLLTPLVIALGFYKVIIVLEEIRNGKGK